MTDFKFKWFYVVKLDKSRNIEVILMVNLKLARELAHALIPESKTSFTYLVNLRAEELHYVA